MLFIILVFSDPRSEMSRATIRGRRTLAAVHRPEPEFNPEIDLIDLTTEDPPDQVAQVDEIGAEALEELPPADLTSSGSQALGLPDLGGRR